MNPSLQRWKHTSPAAHLRRGHPDSAPKRPAREPSAGWAVDNEPTEGDGRGTYGTLVRRWLREGGMAYRARAPGPRRCHSSRRSDARPGRAGKPCTGRRAPGGRQEGREVVEMPSADLRDCAPTGEPCAVKAARTVRGGADGKGLATGPRRPPTPLAPSVMSGWQSGGMCTKPLPDVLVTPMSDVKEDRSPMAIRFAH